MARSRLAAPVALACASLAALIIVRPDVIPSSDPTPIDLSAADDAARPELVDMPEGPFDPVATRPAPEASRRVIPSNVVVNDPSSEPTGYTQSEVGIWVAGDEVVIGWNDAAGFFGGESVTGYGYSSDRGETFTDGGELPNDGSSSVFGDPTIVKLNNGEWLIGSIDGGSPLGTAVNRGTFAGGVLDFDPPETFVDGGFLDKEYLDYDPYTDTLYLTYVGAGVRIVSSGDGGATWSSPTTVSNGAHGPYPAPGIDGEVYVTMVDPLGSGNADIQIRYSADGGASFDPIRTVATTSPQSGSAPDCFNRSFNILFPSADVDRSNGPHRGRVHLTWTDGGSDDYDVYYAYSDDKGVTWSDTVQLNDNDNDGETESFWPQMRVSDLDGRIGVGWYDRRKDVDDIGLCDFYGVESVDGGETWGPNRRLSDTSVSWCGVPSEISPNFGDYVDVTIDDRSLYAVWSDARNGDPDVVFSRYDDRHTMSVSGDVASTPVPVSGDGVAWFMPNEAEFTDPTSPTLDTTAQMTIPGLMLGFLATPAESEGAWQLGNGGLTASLTLSSDEGSVVGTATITETGDMELDMSFDVDADASLNGLGLLSSWTADVTLNPSTPNFVQVGGTVTMGRLLGPLEFTVTGTITLDGAHGTTFPSTQTLDHQASLTTDADGLTLHTRTLVEDAGVVAVEEPAIVAGANPFPDFRISASPNPIVATSEVTYDIDRDTHGTIAVYAATGRQVRVVAEGAFEKGRHSFAFDGRDDAGRRLAPGAYFVRLTTPVARAAKKVVVIP